MEKYNNVYATSSNIKKALRMINVDEEALAKKIIQDAILNQSLHIPQPDFDLLKKLYVFLENPEVFIKEYFKSWKDTLTYLIEEPPCYHINNSCPYLLKDFYNVAIPKKLKMNMEWVQEARDWAYRNRSQINPRQIEIFRDGFIQHFAQKYSICLTINDLETIDLKNSGAEFVDNDIGSVKAKIENLIKLFYRKYTAAQIGFYEKEFAHNRYWYKGEYIQHGSYIEHTISSNLHFIRNSYINPLVKNLYHYAILKFNFKNEYSQPVLDFLNFRPCEAASCGGKSYTIIATL